MNSNPKIERPIFIVGCGKSGTTILYNIICGHPDLAWFSNYFQHWPLLPQLAVLSWFFTAAQQRHWSLRGIPRPDEGYTLWDYCKSVIDSPSDPPLTQYDVTPHNIDRVNMMVRNHMRYQRKSLFINKNMRNMRWIKFVDGIFEDALFILSSVILGRVFILY